MTGEKRKMGPRHDEQPKPSNRQETDEPQEEAEPTAGAAEPEDAPPEQKLAELDDRYRRAVADLANAHKRFQKERERIGKRAVADFVGKLLPMVDNVSHSLKSAHESHDAVALIEGFNLIEAQMLQILNDSGVKAIESVGKPFDPEIHHAVTTEITEEAPPGTVTEELGRGFMIDGLVIRPAQVRVAAAPPEKDEDQENEEE